MKRAVKLLIWAFFISILAAVFFMTALGARNKGKLAHCSNNLRSLGHLAVNLYDAAYRKLNPYDERFARISRGEIKGRSFWYELWSIELKDKKRQISPFYCPFVKEEAMDPKPLILDSIDYRGPLINALDSTGRYIVFAADRLTNHGHGSPINVLILKLDSSGERIEGEFKIETASPQDDLWLDVKKNTTD